MDINNTDEFQLENSSINKTDDKNKNTKNTDTEKGKEVKIKEEVPLFKPEQKGKKEDFYVFENDETSFTSKESGIKSQDLLNYGNIYKGQDITKLRGTYQSNWDRIGNLGVRVAANFVGGTLQSIGSVGAIGKAIYDEASGKDADFTNSLMEFGESIKEAAKENFPNYRKTPDISFNVSDPAWWFEGVESTFSALEFMIGGAGAIKGVGGVAKLLKAEKALVKLGVNAQKLKLGTKIATGAIYSRNAESLMEAVQLRKETKDKLLNQWNLNEEEFQKLKESEVGQELINEGREFTKENLANFIAGKAGWESYKVNSLNVIFDAIQLAPILKGFNPNTRISKLATKNSILDTNKSLLNSTIKPTKYGKFKDYLNPLISSLGASWTEGVEEAVNYIGTKEGEYLADVLSNQKDKSNITDRLSSYLTDSKLWESATLGVFGGLNFQLIGGLTNKIQNKNNLNDTETIRLQEIKNRLNLLNNASQTIKSINDNTELSEEEKNENLDKIKSELSLNLGLNASQAGNVNLLIEQVKSKEYADKLVELGIAQQGDVDKAIANTIKDIELSESLYKKYINTFEFSTSNQRLKNDLIQDSIQLDFLINKNKEQFNKLSNKVEQLKKDDTVYNSITDPQLESLIELESLQTVKTAIKDFLKDEDKENQILSNRGKEKLNSIEKRISELKEQTKDSSKDILLGLNEKIFDYQSQIELIKAANEVQYPRLQNLSNKKEILKKEKEYNKQEKDNNDLIASKIIEDINKGLEKDTLKIEDLEKIVNTTTGKVKTFAQNKIKEIKTKEELNKRQLQKEEIINTELPKPVFEFKEVDEGNLKDYYKQDIDELFLNNKIEDLKESYASDDFIAVNPNEGQYARNKVLELENKNLQSQQELKDLNQNTINDTLEFEFNEYAEDSISNKKITLKDLEDGKSYKDLDINKDEEQIFASKNNEDLNNLSPTRISHFLFNTKYNWHKYFQTKNGNILINSKYTDTLKYLLTPEMPEGAELEISWDKDNEGTLDKFKNDINNAAFKITYNNVIVGYLGTVNALEIEVKRANQNNNIELYNKLSSELEKVKKMRSILKLDDTVFKTKLIKKERGTVLSVNKKTEQRGIKGIFKNDIIWSLNPSNLVSNTKLVNLSNQEEYFESRNPLVNKNGNPNYGKVYGALTMANGDLMPVPLIASLINKEQSKLIKDLTDKLLTLLNTGVNTENKEVQNIKDELSLLISVDTKNNFNKPVGYRVFPKGKNQEGETTEARIEIGYLGKNGDFYKAVVRKNEKDSYVGIFDLKGNKLKQLENGINNEEFLKILQFKKHNINFRKLSNDSKVEINGKEYNSYKDYLLEEDILKTDIAQVVDSNNEVISNVFGFDNDFGLHIDSNLENYIDKEKSNQIELNKEQLESIDYVFEQNPELANAIYEALGFYKQLSLKDILKEYTLEDLKQGVNLRSLQSKIEEKDLETIKRAYNYLKSEEKYIDIKNSNEQIENKLEKLREELKLTKETKTGDVLTIINYENNSDYKVKVFEINRYSDYAILKVKTAKNKEYTIKVDSIGDTKTGFIKDFVFKGINIENAEKIKEEINNLKFQLQELKPDYSDYYIDYFEGTTEITPQQKQQAIQQYSQYLDSLNKPNTNPILQGNQQEQVKKFTELQERLNNKEFLEGAKDAYESTPALQQFGTQEQYNDYIARVSLGIIKNPSSGEYNYTSKVKDIVYHGSPEKIEVFDKSKLGINTGSESAKNAFFFASNPFTSFIYTWKTWDLGQDESSGSMEYAAIYQIGKFTERFNEKTSLKELLSDKEVQSISSNNVYLLLLERLKKFDVSNKKESIFFPISENQTIRFDKDYSNKTKGVFTITTQGVGEENFFGIKEKEEVISEKEFDNLVKKGIEYLESIKPDIKIYQMILNSQNPLIVDDKNQGFRQETYAERINKAKKEKNDSVIINNTADPVPNSDIYAVFEPEQIHILGSKQDIEGFKEFVIDKLTFQKTDINFLKKNNIENEVINNNYKEKYSLNNNNVNVKQTLKEINNNPLNNNIKVLSKFLQSAVKNTNVQISLNNLEKAYNGKYNRKSNTIEINNSINMSEVLFQQTLLHEIVHAETINKVFDWFTNPSREFSLLTSSNYNQRDISEFEFKDNTPIEVIEFFNKILVSYNKTLKQLESKYGKTSKNLAKNKDVFYGLENVFEYMSEILTNENFRKEVKELKGNKTFLQELYNSIIEFLNKILNLNIENLDEVKRATNLIKDFIDKDIEIKNSPSLDLVFGKRFVDILENNFTSNEVDEIINQMQGIILNTSINKKLQFEAKTDRNEIKLKEAVKLGYLNYLNNICKEEHKAKTNLVIKYFDELYDKSLNLLTRSLNIDEDLSLEEVENELLNLTKDYNDKAHFKTSSENTVTNEIKMMIMKLPLLKDNKISYDKDNNKVFNYDKSTITGINQFMDFHKIYPYIVRNLIGAKSQAQILDRLRNMSNVVPSLSLLADELSTNINALTQFYVHLASKYPYNSIVAFITNNENGKEIRISDELKASSSFNLLTQEWNTNLNEIINNLDTEEKLNNFRKEKTRLQNEIIVKGKISRENNEELIKSVINLLNFYKIDLSYFVIESALNDITAIDEVPLIQSLFGIGLVVEKKEKNQNFKNLNTLAKAEALVRFDLVENTTLDIKGNMIYSVRNPNFISNYFTNLKNAINQKNNNNIKEEYAYFQKYLKELVNVPKNAYDNWLWDDKDKPGIIKYEVKNGKRVPLIDRNGFYILNETFLNNFNFHNFGGAKELLSKNSQDYTDFSDKDWRFVSLISYLKLNDKGVGKRNNNTAFYPSIIPSDSGSMFMFEALKISLNKEDFNKSYKIQNGKQIFDKLTIKRNVKNETPIFKAIYRTVLQEIEEIKAAQSLLFDIDKDGKITIKENLNVNSLQQYYHYGKEAIYNEDGTINLEKTLIKDGKPTGGVFKFNNLSISENEKTITLNDIEGIKSYNGLILDYLPNIETKVKDFTEKFINQQIEKGLLAYKEFKLDLLNKHDNISDGSYEALIAEYVLNTYINNSQLFNFFNGNINEYKSKIETNKRAKQLFAPGLSLSIEAMKIQYANGSYSDGKTFKAITIKDFITSSNSLNFKINSVKNLIIKEKNFTEKEIQNFNEEDLLKGKPKTDLEKEVYNIIKGYLKINAGDAQGYISLDRYEAIQRGLGNFNDLMKIALNKAREGKDLNFNEIKNLPPIKGFYYGRDFNPLSNRFQSNQIKYSTFPLIPNLVEGTPLQKLSDYMNKNAVDEVFFESAHKEGASIIYNIFNEDGTINELVLNNAIPKEYYNKNWQLQLTVPDHLVDTENLLATQIAKLIIANISDNDIYTLYNKSYTGKELKETYFNLLVQNIEKEKDNLIKDLGVEITEEGYIIKDTELQKILLEEVKKRGLSENYAFAIEIEDNKFKLPLWSNNISTKWEAILTSIFTNRIVKQKLPGGSAVLASRIGLDKRISLKNYKKGIKWSKEKQDDNTLKTIINEKGEATVEILLGGWAKDLYKEGKLIDIDALPDELKTMIAYRIPTQAKHSMVVLKVVGFLPEESKGLIITPDDLVTQMGSDFDVDKVFLMYKSFYRIDDTFIIPNNINSEEEFEILKTKRKEKYSQLEDYKQLIEDTTLNNLIDKLYERNIEEDLNFESNLIKKEIKFINEKLNEVSEINENTRKLKINNSKIARNNTIVDIYKTILKNPIHFKEIITPAEFESFVFLKKEIEDIFNINDDNINPLTEEVQRLFRNRNISGRALKSISANLNAFGAIAQETKMYLKEGFTFKFKVGDKEIKKQILDKNGKVITEYIDIYDKKTLLKRYGEDIKIENNFAIIRFNKLGYANDSKFLNINGQLILEHASQGIGAAVDIVKDPTFDAFNATTYTYGLFHTMLLSGIDTRMAGMFIRQPVIKILNDYYFSNKSLLNEENGKEIEVVKRYLQTSLAELLLKNNKITPTKEITKIIKKREKDKIVRSYDTKYLMFFKREDTKNILGYDPDTLLIFSIDDLLNNLNLNVNKNRNLDETINYYISQLQILEYFNKFKKSSEKLNDIMRASKTDALGAGPTLTTSSELIRLINKLKDNNVVLINGKPAIQSLYPKHFNLQQESLYKPLESYFENCNKLSLEILNNVFINQKAYYKNPLYTLRRVLEDNLKEEDIKTLNKFLTFNLIKDFKYFNNINKQQLLGIDKINVNKEKDLKIQEFRNLSIAEQVNYLKNKKRLFLRKNPQHILNFLTPLLKEEDIKNNGYHKIEFKNYKDERTDDNLANSITSMYDSGNSFEKELALNLIKYSYITTGLNFGLNSFSKTIPNEVLYDLNYGDYLNSLKDVLNFSDNSYNILNLFYKNNWNNSTFVPKVSTKWDYEEKDGKRRIKTKEGKDENGADIQVKLTINNSPIWNIKSSILSFKDYNIPNKIKNNPYVLVEQYNKDTKVKEQVLYKKYIQVNLDENGKEDFIDKFNGKVFYYQVNKLGKDNINELNVNEIFNNQVINETKNLQDVETIIYKENIKKITDTLSLENTPENKIEKIIEKCNYRTF
ncbi:MAG: hypothetical protein EKK61_03720 [Rickettsiales bacterium]|nr:MAG: hypothetical protein EKK61_03720 [Rickettsiales bacterium]